jgi:uncharacterized protein
VIIDIHAHIGDFTTKREHVAVTPDSLIARMNAEEIGLAVVLPFGNAPESVPLRWWFSPYPGIVDQIRITERYPGRLIPFGSADPRMGGNTVRTDFSWILERFVEMGCVGIGEVVPNIPIDDPRVVNLIRQCGRWQLPVLYHGTRPGKGRYGLIDEVGSPRLRRLLDEVPDATVIGHGPGFWAEIGGPTEDHHTAYPSGPITEEGSLPGLLRTYPHLFADLSARSRLNAISRDEPVGIRFLNEFQDKLLCGTDVCLEGEEWRMPHPSFLHRLLAAGQISPAGFDKIASGNALRILRRLRIPAGERKHGE